MPRYRTTQPEHRPNDRGRSPNRRWLLNAAGILMMVLGLALAIVPNALAAIVVPNGTMNLYFQTTGPLAELDSGDYTTNDPVSVTGGSSRDPAGFGDNSPHRLFLIIPCVPNVQYTVELFDPAIDPGVTPDEMRDDQFNNTTDPQWFDRTMFRLLAPNGSVLQETVFDRGTSNDAWTLFATISVGANPQPGQTCGNYVVEARTGAIDPYEIGLYNDDNAWELRLNGVGFEAELGPDGQPGTGDEAAVGLGNLSYHVIDDNLCADLYWVVEQGSQNLVMQNFDFVDREVDGIGLICYFPPGVQGDCTNGYPGPPVILGTVSGSGSWNDTPDFASQSVGRPTFDQMQKFDPTQGDFTGDAIANPAPGVWRAQLCPGTDSQFSFHVNAVLFTQPPQLPQAVPQLVVTKDDGVDVVTSPGQTTYTITITNIGQGDAAILPGNAPEIVDILPAGMTFVSCQVNAPLIGTCSETSPGRVEYQITGYQGFPAPIFLPGAGSGANTATVTLTAAIDPGLADGTQLEDVVTVEYSDPSGRTFSPVSDNDIDIVVAQGVTPTVTPDPTQVQPTAVPGDPGGGPAAPASAPVAGQPALAKFVSPEVAAIGETVTWTIRVTNPADTPTGSVTVTDTIPPAVELVRVSSSRGTPAVSGSSFSVNLGEIQPGEEVVITAETVAQQILPPAQSCNQAFAGSMASNEACVTILPAELPAFGGGAPPTPAAPLRILWQWVLGGGLLMVAGLGLMRWSARLPEA